jgi:hypothetical protein
MTYQKALYNSGYVTHLNTGLYKNANGWGSGGTGWYAAIGGNDSYPTQAWYLTYDAYIQNSLGYVLTGGSFRAPIFYDLNNTGYYVDAASTTNLNALTLQGGIPTINGYSPSNGVIRMTPNLHLNSGAGNAVIVNWDNGTTGGSWTFRVGSGNGGGDVYYIRGDGYSYQTNYAENASSFRAPIFYDNADTGYYVDAASTTNLNVVAAANRIYTGYDSGSTNSVSCSNWFRSNGASGWFNASYGGGIWQSDSTYVQVYNGKAFYVPNNIDATGNVTAYYSDERLKIRTGLIENAIDKVKTLDGFYYVENETAKELGYNNDSQQVGLSAQQVQAILPEAIHMAPVDIAVDENGNKYSKTGENYLTVDYSRLVPLLIEAIKEQQEHINRLEVKINSLQQGN